MMMIICAFNLICIFFYYNCMCLCVGFNMQPPPLFSLSLSPLPLPTSICYCCTMAKGHTPNCVLSPTLSSESLASLNFSLSSWSWLVRLAVWWSNLTTDILDFGLQWPKIYHPLVGSCKSTEESKHSVPSWMKWWVYSLPLLSLMFVWWLKLLFYYIYWILFGLEAWSQHLQDVVSQSSLKRCGQLPATLQA